MCIWKLLIRSNSLQQVDMCMYYEETGIGYENKDFQAGPWAPLDLDTAYGKHEQVGFE